MPAGVSASEVSAVERAQHAMAYFNQGRYIDAVFLWQLVLRSNPNAKNIKLSLASAYERLGMPDDALQFYSDLIQAAPEDPTLLAGKARILVRAERYKDAKAAYELSLTKFLERGDASAAADQAQSLSALAFRLGDEEGALCYARQAQTLKPTRPLALRVVRLLFSSGRVAQARAVLASVTEEPGAASDPLVLFALAQSSYSSGNLQDALSLLERAQTVKLPDPSDQQEVQLFERAVKFQLAATSHSADSEEKDEGEEGDLAIADKNLIYSRGIYWPPSAQAKAVEMLAGAL